MPMVWRSEQSFKQPVKVLVRKLDENEKTEFVIRQNQTMKWKHYLRRSLNVVRVNWSGTSILESIDLSSLTTKQKDFCEIEVGNKEIWHFKIYAKNKTPIGD